MMNLLSLMSDKKSLEEFGQLLNTLKLLPDIRDRVVKIQLDMETLKREFDTLKVNADGR